MRRSDAADILKKAIPAQVLQIPMEVQSESHSNTGRSCNLGLITGLVVVVVEARIPSSV